jgi:hypothetical protein
MERKILRTVSFKRLVAAATFGTLYAILALGPVDSLRAQFATQSTFVKASGVSLSSNVYTIALPNVTAIQDILGVDINIVAGSNINTTAASANVSGTGSQPIRKPSAGGLVALTGGEVAGTATIMWDGAEYLLKTVYGGTVNIGDVEDFGGTSCPGNTVLANGQSLLRTAYPQLFAAIGTTWGFADGTHFNAPNVIGRVVRYIDGGSGLGGPSAVSVIQADQVGPWSGSGSTGTVATSNSFFGNASSAVGGLGVVTGIGYGSAGVSVSGGAAQTQVRGVGMTPCARAF